MFYLKHLIAYTLCRVWRKEEEEVALAKWDYGSFMVCIVGAKWQYFTGLSVPRDLQWDKKETLLVSLWAEAVRLSQIILLETYKGTACSSDLWSLSDDTLSVFFCCNIRFLHYAHLCFDNLFRFLVKEKYNHVGSCQILLDTYFQNIIFFIIY